MYSFIDEQISWLQSEEHWLCKTCIYTWNHTQKTSVCINILFVICVNAS